jgi:hypothetical protein
MFLMLISMLTPDPCLLAPDAARIDQLITQLGSEFYAEREVATKALNRAGAPALEPLQRACEGSDDAEIRRRAERLIMAIEPRVRGERALAIRRSKLSPEEKGQKLKDMVKAGMSAKEVHRLLGSPNVAEGNNSSCLEIYLRYRLAITYVHDRVECKRDCILGEPREVAASAKPAAPADGGRAANR